MEWDATLYQKRHAFVSEYGKWLLNFVNTERHRDVLDLGCGTGELTEELCRRCAHVVGIDASHKMVETARARFPERDFRVMDALNLPFEDAFDLIFSNAVFHWIVDQETLLAGVYRSLRDGGALVCEFGAQGNIQGIEQAYVRAVTDMGGVYNSPFIFPSEQTYEKMLHDKGFFIAHLFSYDRPTPLCGGEEGLSDWLKQFFAADLSKYDAKDQTVIFERVEEDLRDSHWDGTQWTADYRRLQVVAYKFANRG